MRENRNKSYNNSYSDRNQENSPTLSEMVKKEQEYRHQWQDKYLKVNSLTFRLGQLFGLIYNLAVLYLIYSLIKEGEKDLALKIFVLNLVIIAFALLVTTIERKILWRKPARRGKEKRFNKSRGRYEKNDRERNDRNDRNDRDRNDRNDHDRIDKSR
jgi:uncharacterized membrane protein